MNETAKTVLIVDDEAFIRQSFVDYFEDRLWYALQAQSAEQALKLLETESPRAAIVDIRLRGMDGEAFIRKACKQKARMAFVVCTGSPEYDLPEILSENPNVCSRVFRKPVENMSEIESNLLQLIANLEAAKGP